MAIWNGIDSYIFAVECPAQIVFFSIRSFCLARTM